SVAESTDACVTLSYRGAAFSRARARNRERLERARRAGRLHVLMQSHVKHIGAQAVLIEQRGKQLRLPNHAVIVAAGGIVPTEFLKSVGVQMQTKYGTA
ncbi:MAG TPA: 4Fe-4S ferredoxin, partial [Candidatus Dormibacteraeota bacterium]|nr:4Fe-4S ferredoxin [Candidatus Dormibacteraeota bacterium]